MKMQLQNVLENRFKPLSDTELELVWQWRNLPHIRQNMHNDRIISWQEHQQWFKQLLQTPDKVYLLLFQNDRPVGTLYFDGRPADSLEWGCYLGAQNLWPGTGLLLEIAALDYAAQYTQAHSLLAEVLSFNSTALKMHRLFGYHELAPIKDAGSRDGNPYDVLKFSYALADWKNCRTNVLAKLPKQIALAADLLIFDL